jgi:flagellar biosynthesis/type III secretory pathway protein FliH
VNKAELMAMLEQMLESGDTTNVMDLVETAVNEITADARREAAAEGYREGRRDGIAEARGETTG